jgi:Peptidase S46
MLKLFLCRPATRALFLPPILLLVMFAMLTNSSSADEGMWLFNNPPGKLLNQKYGFEPSAQWLEHLQRAAVRFNDGGSGSFISADGLVLTNHHVGRGALQKLSTPEHDYTNEGFHAKTRADEMRAVDSELNVLQSIEDVTDRVNAAVKPGMTSAQAHEAIRAVTNTIEKESHDATGLRSDVVALYHGAVYHLYRYKRYTDVRIVFAPEEAIAFFGGDPDNFEYPRYDLDFCLFRVYEDGKPAKIEHYLKWSPQGVHDGELVFVAGHPGHTDRMDTVDHLEFIRDMNLPRRLDQLYRREVVLGAFGARSQENSRRAQNELLGAQNSRKALGGQLAGLQDPATMARKREEEKSLRDKLAEHERSGDAAKLKADLAAWDDVAAALAAWRKIYTDLDMLEAEQGFNSRLFRLARTLVRLPTEDAKPNAERFPEFTESSRPSLEQRLYSTAPIYDNLETLNLADSLSSLVTKLGADNELVVKVLAGKSPRDRAAELIHGTKLKDVAERKRLAAGGTKAIDESTDPMIELARLIDPPSRALRKKYEEEVQEPLRQAYSKIAAARFAITGTDTYPDATFTLRLAFGVVKGFTDEGQTIPPWTTMGGAFERAAEHKNQEPFRLPESWLKHKDRLELTTPMDFICTADIIGGNSGSPVVNRRGELVGLIFDGNIHSLVLDFVYTDEKARAVAVDTRAIVEALRKIYDAGEIADEIAGKTRVATKPAR